MNQWYLAAMIQVAALAPCCWVIYRRTFCDGLIALVLAGTLATLAFLCIAEGERRQGFADLALVCAAGSLIGSLLFARFLERARRRPGAHNHS